MEDLMPRWRPLGDPTERARRQSAKLRLLAWAALKHGDPDGALADAGRAVALAEQKLGAQSSEHGAALADLLICQIATGEPDERCTRTLDRLEEIEAAAHDGFVDSAGNLVAMLVTVVITKVGNSSAAMVFLCWLGEAMARRRPREAMDTILQASQRLEQRNCLGEAYELAALQARLCEAACGATDPRVVGTFNRLGLLLKRLDRLDEAVAAYERALDVMAARPTDPRAKAALLNNLGTTHAARRQYPQAVQCLGAALELARNFLPPGDRALHATLFNLADALCHCHDYEKAAPVMLEYLGQPDGARREAALYALAASTLRRGATADAIAYLHLIKHLQEQPDGKDINENLANTLCLLGEAAFDAENYQAAAEHHRAGLAMRRQLQATGTIGYRLNLARLAECYVRIGDARAAEPLLEELDRVGAHRHSATAEALWRMALGEAATMPALGCAD
jgi:tetratricopeptide (TPR) repeat protein